MMNKKNIYFLLILSFLILVIPSKLVAQGPNAPEAASFEPVDATDMVNLTTGNLSYVLPLLNVSGPEGGYPIALSYHAGIAMDQESTWVGLGWSVNPGSINRGVNGYPDDWGDTIYNEFFYDAGWDEDYYSFDIGVSINDVVSVGIGATWGTNQSLGGHVSLSVGVSDALTVGGSIGTNGASINAGVGKGQNVFRASIGTNGVGIGYGINKGGNTFGISLNYNYSSGLSGGINVTKSLSSFKNGARKSVGVGISFSSNGINMNAKVNGNGTGISNSVSSINGGDYDIKITNTGISIPVYYFYVSYSHTNVKYSLYKNNFLKTSGMLYPVEANKIILNNGSLPPRLLNTNSFMDINSMQKFSQTNNYDDLLDNENGTEANNLILPNYDNYTVSAQGVSGSISPYFNSELNLSGRGNNSDDITYNFLNHSLPEYHSAPSSGINVNRDAVQKVNFTFNSVYNSFLRHETTNVRQGAQTLSPYFILNTFDTEETQSFSNSNSLVEKVKREGNSIKTYTNEEIRNSIAGFIEAKNIDRQELDIFLDNGIGAYKITVPDGKIYHYSLPVYQYESFYKNFKDENNEDDNFFEITKIKPYATHWLLTAITGPDYIDINNNGQIDKDDYGYWVEFDYGKWSDGYVWKTPNGRFEEIENKDHPTDKTFSYSYGRKQIYYLDAIKTRTHTALFIKDLRDDNKGNLFETYAHKILPGENFDLSYNSEIIHNDAYPTGCVFSPRFTMSPSIFDNFTFYEHNDNPRIISYNDIDVTNGDYYTYLQFTQKESYKYYDTPKTSLLKLKKIILLRNEAVIVQKNDGFLLNTTTGKVASAQGYKGFRYIYRDGNFNNRCDLLNSQPHYVPDLLGNKKYYKEYTSHIDDNVFDVSDIQGLNLESKAQQVIEFEHDYSLAKNSPNSDAIGEGRLTLSKVFFKGKEGVQIVPPYQFSYNMIGANFNSDDIDDWGYHKTNPEIWSLNEITTPIGQKIKMEYESDEYYSAVNHAISFIRNDNHYWISHVGSYPNIQFYIDSEINILNSGDNVNLIYNLILGGIGQVITYDDNAIVGQYVNGLGYLITPTGNPTITQINPGPGGGFEYYAIYSNQINGGGIRTKSITISNGTNDIAKSEYQYNNPETNETSGITSYAPSKKQKGVPYVSELPPPMVMYGNVKMLNYDGNNKLLGSTAYEFETLEPKMEESGYIFSLGEAFKVKENQNTTFNNGNIVANKFTIENNLGILGRLNATTSYNSLGQVLSTTKNHYKTDLDSDGEIGVTQESHKSVKRVLNNGDETYYVSSTSKVSYPNVLESTTTTQGGFTVTSHNDKFDFLTGQLLETTTFTSDGTKFKSKTVPAYTIPAYEKMGSKVDDPTFKNMLTQQAASYSYILNNDTQDWQVVNASINTWNNDWSYRKYNGSTNSPIDENQKIWRKHKTYAWKGEIDEKGTYVGYNDTNDDNFNWGLGATQTNQKWKNIATTTLYDHYSMPLETRDINGNHAATKMGDDNTKVFATANAKYGNMFFSGAEDKIPDVSFYSGEVSFDPSATFNEDLKYVHTGLKSVLLPKDKPAFSVKPEEGGLYKVSVWVYKDLNNRYLNTIVRSTTLDYNFNPNEIINAGKWAQLNFSFKVSAGEQIKILSTSGSIYFDDFRMIPIASTMTSYVYNKWDELSYILGANNMATKYEYDQAGRLKYVYTEVEDALPSVTGGFKLVKEYNINYKFYSVNNSTPGVVRFTNIVSQSGGDTSANLEYINTNVASITFRITTEFQGEILITGDGIISQSIDVFQGSPIEVSINLPNNSGNLHVHVEHFDGVDGFTEIEILSISGNNEIGNPNSFSDTGLN